MGRDLGVGAGLAVGVGEDVGVAVAVAVAVGVAVAVAVAVGVGVGVAPDRAQYLPPVARYVGNGAWIPPHTIISLPVQIAV